VNEVVYSSLDYFVACGNSEIWQWWWGTATDCRVHVQAWWLHTTTSTDQKLV